MTSITLDGSTRYVGTEFIKLEITGSSNLATEQYVQEQVAGGGGGVDLSNYYTKTETDGLFTPYYTQTQADNLLDTKLNVNNPQDIEGTLRLGSVGGASKIILNSVGDNGKDFYVNGDSQVLGNLEVASLDSSSYIKGTNLISNTINADNLNDIFFQSNGTNYLQLDVSENKLVSSKLIQCGGNLTTQEIDTIANLDLVIKRNNVDYITLADGQVNFNQPTNISVDTTNLVKKTGETDQRIDGTVSVNGDTITGYELTVNGQVHTQGMFVASNTNLIFGNANRYITNPPTSNHIRHYTNGEHQFYCNGVEDFLIDQDKALARGNMLCVGQFQGNTFNSFNNNTADVEFRKANLEFIKLGGAKLTTYFAKGVASNIYDSVDNADVTFKRNFVDFFYLRNNTVDLSAGITLQTSSAKIDTIDTVGDNDLAFKRNNDSFMSFSQATGKIFLQKDVEVQGDVTFIANKTIKIDNLDTVGDTDLVIKRNNVEYFKLNGAQNIIDVATGRALSSQYIYGDFFRARNFNADMVFEGGNATGDGRVEIFRYEYANEQLDFNTAINNTGRPVIGNIQDTTVSDEKLKKEIEDVDVDVSDIIKKVNVKSFEYKDKKYGVGKQIGFLANELLNELPEIFSKNIIGKDKEDNLNMNYMKINTVLWKCNQELINKVEYLEATMYEMMEEIKELKGKKKPKAKAKPKVEK